MDHSIVAVDDVLGEPESKWETQEMALFYLDDGALGGDRAR